MSYLAAVINHRILGLPSAVLVPGGLDARLAGIVFTTMTKIGTERVKRDPDLVRMQLRMPATANSNKRGAL